MARSPPALLCGDSTQPEAVREAMGGATAGALFTDAPYGVAYRSHLAEGGTASRFKPIENDNLRPEALQAFLTVCFTNAARCMRPGAAVYACHADQKPGLYPAFERALLDSGFTIAGVIVWVKPAATMGWQDYRNQYEPLLYGWKAGADRMKVTDRTETNVWQIARDAASSYEARRASACFFPAERGLAFASRRDAPCGEHSGSGGGREPGRRGCQNCARACRVIPSPIHRAQRPG